MFSSHSYLTTYNMTTIFETDHTILNSLTRMRILTTVILLFGNYTKTRIDCSVAFWQLFLNEDCIVLYCIAPLRAARVEMRPDEIQQQGNHAGLPMLHVCATITSALINCNCQRWLGMHDEIFHFEMIKNFHGIFKYFKTPSLKYFMKFFISIIKWLKTFKNMIKVYEVSTKYIMLFMHNNRYLPLTGLLTLLQWTIQPAPMIVHREISGNISEILHEIFHEIFHAKKSHEILHH